MTARKQITALCMTGKIEYNAAYNNILGKY